MKIPFLQSTECKGLFVSEKDYFHGRKYLESEITKLVEEGEKKAWEASREHILNDIGDFCDFFWNDIDEWKTQQEKTNGK